MFIENGEEILTTIRDALFVDSFKQDMGNAQKILKEANKLKSIERDLGKAIDSVNQHQTFRMPITYDVDEMEDYSSDINSINKVTYLGVGCKF